MSGSIDICTIWEHDFGQGKAHIVFLLWAFGLRRCILKAVVGFFWYKTQPWTVTFIYRGYFDLGQHLCSFSWRVAINPDRLFKRWLLSHDAASATVIEERPFSAGVLCQGTVLFMLHLFIEDSLLTPWASFQIVKAGGKLKRTAPLNMLYRFFGTQFCQRFEISAHLTGAGSLRPSWSSHLSQNVSLQPWRTLLTPCWWQNTWGACHM